jgi:hypothetical protein
MSRDGVRVRGACDGIVSDAERRHLPPTPRMIVSKTDLKRTVRKHSIDIACGCAGVCISWVSSADTLRSTAKFAREMQRLTAEANKEGEATSASVSRESSSVMAMPATRDKSDREM